MTTGCLPPCRRRDDGDSPTKRSPNKPMPMVRRLTLQNDGHDDDDHDHNNFIYFNYVQRRRQRRQEKCRFWTTSMTTTTTKTPKTRTTPRTSPPYQRVLPTLPIQQLVAHLRSRRCCDLGTSQSGVRRGAIKMCFMQNTAFDRDPMTVDRRGPRTQKTTKSAGTTVSYRLTNYSPNVYVPVSTHMV